MPPSFRSLFWTLEKHFRAPLVPIWPTISLDADRDREPWFFTRPDHRKRTRRIRRHLGVCVSETSLQRRRPPDWQAPIWMSHHVVLDCVGALVEIADRSLATQPEQVEEEKKDSKVKIGSTYQLPLHPARPSLLSLTAVLDPTTARPNAWKLDVRELLDINSHDTPLVYRWVVRTSPRKYVTAVDKVRKFERRLLPAQQRHYSPTCWSEATWQQPPKCTVRTMRQKNVTLTEAIAA